MEARDIIKLYNRFRNIDKFVRKVTTNQHYIDYIQSAGCDFNIPSLKDKIDIIMNNLTLNNNVDVNSNSYKAFSSFIKEYEDNFRYTILNYPYSKALCSISIDVEIKDSVNYYTLLFKLVDDSRKGVMPVHSLVFNGYELLEEYLTVGIDSFERIYKE